MPRRPSKDERLPESQALPGTTKLTPALRERLLELAKLGTTYDGMAAAVGVSADSLLRWRDVVPGFAEELARARASTEPVLLDVMYRAATSGQRDSWRAAETYLGHLKPEVYGRTRGALVTTGADAGSVAVHPDDDIGKLAKLIRNDDVALQHLSAFAERLPAGALKTLHARDESNGSLYSRPSLNSQRRRNPQ